MTNYFTFDDFYCTNCGKKNISVARRLGQQREPGHLKNLYCPYCKQEHNAVEVKEHCLNYTVEDFFLEFNNGNFNEDGTRKMPFKKFKGVYNDGKLAQSK